MAKNVLNNEQIDFIKKSVDSKEVSSKRAKEIRKMFPEIFADKFKKGDWIICDDAKNPRAERILFISDNYYKTCDNLDVLGFRKDKEGLRLAKDDEIIKRMHNLSKSRGYQAGKKIKALWFPSKYWTISGTERSNYGDWAKIIKDEFADPVIALDTLKSIDDISKGTKRLIKNLKTLKDELMQLQEEMAYMSLID